MIDCWYWVVQDFQTTAERMFEQTLLRAGIQHTTQAPKAFECHWWWRWWIIHSIREQQRIVGATRIGYCGDSLLCHQCTSVTNIALLSKRSRHAWNDWLLTVDWMFLAPWWRICCLHHVKVVFESTQWYVWQRAFMFQRPALIYCLASLYALKTSGE